MQAFMSQLGTDPASQGGFFAPKPLFWERPAFVIWCAPVPCPICAPHAPLCASANLSPKACIAIKLRRGARQKNPNTASRRQRLSRVMGWGVKQTAGLLGGQSVCAAAAKEAPEAAEQETETVQGLGFRLFKH